MGKRGKPIDEAQRATTLQSKAIAVLGEALASPTALGKAGEALQIVVDAAASVGRLAALQMAQDPGGTSADTLTLAEMARSAAGAAAHCCGRVEDAVRVAHGLQRLARHAP